MGLARLGRSSIVACPLRNEFAAGLRTPTAREVASGRTRTTGTIIITRHGGAVTMTLGRGGFAV